MFSVWMYHSLFNNYYMDGHLGCLQYFSVTMNNLVYVYFHIIAGVSSGKIPRIGIDQCLTNFNVYRNPRHLVKTQISSSEFREVPGECWCFRVGDCTLRRKARDDSKFICLLSTLSISHLEEPRVLLFWEPCSSTLISRLQIDGEEVEAERYGKWRQSGA